MDNGRPPTGRCWGAASNRVGSSTGANPSGTTQPAGRHDEGAFPCRNGANGSMQEAWGNVDIKRRCARINRSYQKIKQVHSTPAESKAYECTPVKDTPHDALYQVVGPCVGYLLTNHLLQVPCCPDGINSKQRTMLLNPHCCRLAKPRKSRLQQYKAPSDSWYCAGRQPGNSHSTASLALHPKPDYAGQIAIPNAPLPACRQVLTHADEDSYRNQVCSYNNQVRHWLPATKKPPKV